MIQSQFKSGVKHLHWPKAGGTFALTVPAHTRMTMVETWEASCKTAVEVQVEEGASLEWLAMAGNVEELHSTLNLRSAGPHARFHGVVAARTRGKEKQHFDLKADLVWPSSHGKIDAYGVADGESELYFNGAVKIHSTGGGSEGYLTEAILNLSPLTRVRAVPALLIDTNDVKAGHSAGVSPVTQEALFYAAARGLNETAAKELMAAGFLRRALHLFPDLAELLYPDFERLLA